jgi:hypothetical protein
LKPHSEATRKDPDPKKIPKASFNVLDLCAKFQDHILTGSTLNRDHKTPQGPNLRMPALECITVIL